MTSTHPHVSQRSATTNAARIPHPRLLRNVTVRVLGVNFKVLFALIHRRQPHEPRDCVLQLRLYAPEEFRNHYTGVGATFLSKVHFTDLIGRVLATAAGLMVSQSYTDSANVRHTSLHSLRDHDTHWGTLHSGVILSHCDTFVLVR